MTSKACGVLAVVCLVAASGAHAADEKPGSVYVQCDGRPEALTVAKSMGYLLAITATAGIVGGVVGGPEAGDVNKRIEGDAAVAACDTAMAQNKVEIRAAQLKLAKAIHLIEAEKYDAAIAETKSLAAVAPGKAAEDGFQRSMGLAAMQIEATALVRSSRWAEAEAVALKMSAAAPYNVLATTRAAAFVGLTTTMTPEKRAYYEQASRLMPSYLAGWAGADEAAGDWASAAAHMHAAREAAQAFSTDPATFHPAATVAHESVDLLLAGDLAASNKTADEARVLLEALSQSTDANRSAQETRAQEMLDFQAAGRLLAEGHAAEARAAFGRRSRWFSPSTAQLAELTDRLRRGLAEAPTGALANDPATIRKDGLDLSAKSIMTLKPIAPWLFAAIWYQEPNAFKNVTGPAWKTDKSRMVVQRKPKDIYIGEVLALPGVYDNEALSEALVLHAALRAQAEGKSAVLMFPTRARLNILQATYGEPGQPGFPAAATLPVAKVVADLSPKMPSPQKN